MTGEYSTPEFRERFTSMAKAAAAGSDLIITVSQFTAMQVLDLIGVERDRLRVIHHGVRMPKIGGESREPIVLHVGAIQKRKNIARLIEAFSALPNHWQLVLAGPEGYGAQEMLAKAHDRVQVTGYMTDDELKSLYRRASIFAFPSLDEGFGMPLLEAMSYGIPVIASNASAIPEVCGDAAILVDPLRAEEIASALQALACDETLRKNYIARGLARAKMFRWEDAVDKTWAVYRELLPA